MYAGEIVLEGPVRKILKEKKISYSNKTKNYIKIF